MGLGRFFLLSAFLSDNFHLHRPHAPNEYCLVPYYILLEKVVRGTHWCRSAYWVENGNGLLGCDYRPDFKRLGLLLLYQCGTNHLSD